MRRITALGHNYICQDKQNKTNNINNSKQPKTVTILPHSTKTYTACTRTCLLGIPVPDHTFKPVGRGWRRFQINWQEWRRWTFSWTIHSFSLAILSNCIEALNRISVATPCTPGHGQSTLRQCYRTTLPQQLLISLELHIGNTNTRQQPKLNSYHAYVIHSSHLSIAWTLTSWQRLLQVGVKNF